MALNPKLNVYVVTLNPKDKDSNPTFRDFFKEKYNVDTTVGDDELKKKFEESKKTTRKKKETEE